MKIYKSEHEARIYSPSASKQFISKLCPFYFETIRCGNWCPHFFTDEAEIFITCSGQEVALGELEIPE